MTKHVTLLNSDGHVRTRAHAARSSRTPLPGRRLHAFILFFPCPCVLARTYSTYDAGSKR
jgi:hypothetical protein